MMDEPSILLDFWAREEVMKNSFTRLSDLEFANANRELYLCCSLGLCLAQEIDEMRFQAHKMASDHAELISEFQKMKTSERMVTNSSRENHVSIDDDVIELRNVEEINNNGFHIEEVGKSSILRSLSYETLDIMDDSSVLEAQELHNDIQLVQFAQLKISKFEGQLDTERAKYRTLMTEYSYKLKDSAKRLGSCVTKTRPYFKALETAKKYQHKAQKIAVEYKKTVNLHKAARDIVKITEERVMNAPDKLNPSWQELLNQSNIKVIEATTAKNRAHQNHLKATNNYQVAEDNRLVLLSKLQKYVTKSIPYFDIQKEFQEKLEISAKKLNLLEVKSLEAQQNYNQSLSQLKTCGLQTSKEQGLKERGVGVGSENPFTSVAGLLPQSVHKDDSSAIYFSNALPSTSRMKLTFDTENIGSDSDDQSDDYILDF